MADSNNVITSRSMRSMPWANPRFNPATAMREGELRPLGFAPVAKFSVVDRQFRITDRQLPPIGPRYVYAHVVDDEVIRIGSGQHLPSRFDQYQRDVTAGITGEMQRRIELRGRKMSETHLAEMRGWKEIMAAYDYGTIYAKPGTLAEEDTLLRKHPPRLTCRNLKPPTG